MPKSDDFIDSFLAIMFVKLLAFRFMPRETRRAEDSKHCKISTDFKCHMPAPIPNEEFGAANNQLGRGHGGAGGVEEWRYSTYDI